MKLSVWVKNCEFWKDCFYLLIIFLLFYLKQRRSYARLKICEVLRMIEVVELSDVRLGLRVCRRGRWLGVKNHWYSTKQCACKCARVLRVIITGTR